MGIFGSYARGEAAADSDIDILVEFNRPIGFFKFLELEERLSQWLGKEVDLVTKAALKPRIGRRILTEAVTVFKSDRKTFNAVVRSLEVIGEAAKCIPEDVQAEAPAIPWKYMARMRDKLIHHYFGVDPEIVWNVIQNELPPLKPRIEKLFNKIVHQQ